MNRRQLLSLIPASALVPALASGCIGSFALTNRVLQWNRGFGSPIVSEVVFLLFLFLPVYESTLLLDAILFNTLEFLTGKNPIGAAPSHENERVAELPDGGRLHLRRNARGVTVTVTSAQGEALTHNFELAEEGATALSENGQLLVSAQLTAEGGLTLEDGEGLPLADYSPETVAELQEAYELGGVEGLVDASIPLQLDAVR